MATKTITWPDGSTAVLTYSGQGSGPITVQSDPNNNYESRSVQVTVKTTDGSNIQRTVTIQQAAKVRTDISNAVVTAANQTYSGTAKTPTPTVTLNGVTIPSSGYDVAYSNNTNAGTATITITGKDDYTGTATGTFTIAKANPNYVAPAARSNLTYSGNSQYLITEGYTTDGTIQYSSNGTTWSTTRPSSTNAGSYTTYWRLVGDSNHNDVASTSLSTTIAKASRTLSFADAYVVLAPSGNITKTATPSAGSGDGAITYSISSTTYATINSSSGKVTAKTSDGSAIVTATIAEGTNYLSATASYNLYVFATTHNFSYTGSYQGITLPPGSYKLQCWGAQGGSNAAESTYGITAQAGGKGGYSEGVLTIVSQTTVRAYVGGQGTSTTGGYNGGGTSTGRTTQNANNHLGVTRMAGGGGATDIRLNDGTLLSRMIVAGGGSGGAMSYRRVTTTTTQWVSKGVINFGTLSGTINGNSINSTEKKIISSYPYTFIDFVPGAQMFPNNTTVRVTASKAYASLTIYNTDGASSTTLLATTAATVNTFTYTVGSSSQYFRLMVLGTKNTTNYWDGTLTFEVQEEVTTVTEDNDSHTGYAGGGTTGDGYSDSVKGTQTAAGSGGSFGEGGPVPTTGSRYASGAGGGGWYGGGRSSGNGWSSAYWARSGGGSGFVNTAANAQYRPSGYTGIELDSGSTTAGSSSFPSTSGSTETGHSGNGYAKITRL